MEKGKKSTHHQTVFYGNGHFHNAAGIDVWNGEIFVADQNNHRVQVLDKQGNYLRKFGMQGTTPKKFLIMLQILVFLSDGNLIIADSNYLSLLPQRWYLFEKNKCRWCRIFVSVGPNGEIFSNQRVRDADGNTLSYS